MSPLPFVPFNDTVRRGLRIAAVDLEMMLAAPPPAYSDGTLVNCGATTEADMRAAALWLRFILSKSA